MSEFSCSDSQLNALWEGAKAGNAEALDDAIAHAAVVSDYETNKIVEVAHAADLVSYVLGIHPGESGYTQVHVSPNPGMLAWAKGGITIPQGDVTVSWTRDARAFTLDVSVPVGVHILTVLPAQAGDALYCDGEPIPTDSVVRRDDARAEICVMPGSSYRFEVVHP